MRSFRNACLLHAARLLMIGGAIVTCEGTADGLAHLMQCAGLRTTFATCAAAEPPWQRLRQGARQPVRY
jgi:hypothetical protein